MPKITVESEALDTIKAMAQRLQDENADLLYCLQHTKKCLEYANEHGGIIDTIWAGDCETLFDFIEEGIAKHTHEAKPL